VNLPVCSFEHKVAASGVASLSSSPCTKDPAFQCGETAKVEHGQWQPLIGHQDSVRRQHFLTVYASLHSAQDILKFKVPPHAPSVCIGQFGQSHQFEELQSVGSVLFYQRRTTTDSGSPAVDRHHHEEWGERIFNLFGVAVDDPIERCIAVLVHLPTPGYGSIQLRTMPKLAGAEIFSYFADAQFDV